MPKAPRQLAIALSLAGIRRLAAGAEVQPDAETSQTALHRQRPAR